MTLEDLFQQRIQQNNHCGIRSLEDAEILVGNLERDVFEIAPRQFIPPYEQDN